MGFRFRKSISLGKGLRLNIGKRSVGISGGVKGFRIGISTRGITESVGIPGTGVYWSQTTRWGRPAKSRKAVVAPTKEPANVPNQRPQTQHDFVPVPAVLARWRRLSWAILVGLIAVWSPPVGTTVGVALLAVAVAMWRRPGRLAYAAYHAARGAWSLGKWEACKQHLGKVLELGVDAPEIRLGLARCEVRLQNWTDAAEAYKAYAERGGILGAQDRLHAATAAVEAGDPHWALSLLADLPAEPIVAAIRAEALLKLDRPTAAIEVCQAAIGRRSKIDRELAIVHHVLARSYEQAGKIEKARRTWEKLYAYDPTFPDAAERLGLNPTAGTE